MELEETFNQLENYFGKSNLKVEYIFESHLDVLNPKQFSKNQLTHLPTGKVIIGEKFDTQIENAIYALDMLKEKLNEI